jgi:hypothetical protein
MDSELRVNEEFENPFHRDSNRESIEIRAQSRINRESIESQQTVKSVHREVQRADQGNKISHHDGRVPSSNSRDAL